MTREKLLPEVLKELWQSVDEQHFSGEQFYYEQQHHLEGYRQIWREALALEGHRHLRESLLWELGAYVGCDDLTEIERRCMMGWKGVEDEWRQRVDPASDGSIERFYNCTEAYLYDLIWWHALTEDDTPLAYVTALQFAKRNSCRTYLDFGSGISSGGILFARQGFEIASADISSSLLRFGAWRLGIRGLDGSMIDLKEREMPTESFDLITAMDVFEHLTDPVGAADKVARALRPQGFLYGRFALESDDRRPQHIVHDFQPVFRRLRALGFEQVWEDDWLWGHQVFQKP